MKENEENKNQEKITNDYCEQYKGIIGLRKVKIDEKDVWIGTVGKQLVSDGAFDTKEQLIENLENVTLGRVTRIAAGIFGRLVELKNEKHEG